MSDTMIAYCLSKPGASEEYPFGPRPLVMKAGGKMFALISCEGDRYSISLKCDPVIAANLREQNPAIRPGYHLNKQHWNTVVLDGSLSESELQAMIDHSYDLVVRSLPKAKRQSLATGNSLA